MPLNSHLAHIRSSLIPIDVVIAGNHTTGSLSTIFFINSKLDSGQMLPEALLYVCLENSGFESLKRSLCFSRFCGFGS